MLVAKSDSKLVSLHNLVDPGTCGVSGYWYLGTRTKLVTRYDYGEYHFSGLSAAVQRPQSGPGPLKNWKLRFE